MDTLDQPLIVLNIVGLGHTVRLVLIVGANIDHHEVSSRLLAEIPRLRVVCDAVVSTENKRSVDVLGDKLS